MVFWCYKRSLFDILMININTDKGTEGVLLWVGVIYPSEDSSACIIGDSSVSSKEQPISIKFISIPFNLLINLSGVSISD